MVWAECLEAYCCAWIRAENPQASRSETLTAPTSCFGPDCKFDLDFESLRGSPPAIQVARIQRTRQVAAGLVRSLA